jgi:hypothetical protein
MAIQVLTKEDQQHYHYHSNKGGHEDLFVLT